ncbi:uncharacterized protein RSE6_02038 [Rhynchosporium secalis]|uniref:Uncharacterized protein n=1 Tax=Rhynchosporium secalis TaxID=38038 RepID=A0A1E1LZ93_RHYSE|nr:uncharacterized protein RSE6_02038 [Rhynchosporium secalis]
MAPAKRYGIKTLSEIEIILIDVGTDDISDQYDEHQRNGHEENIRTWDLALGEAAASTGSSDPDFAIDVVAAVKGTRQAYGQSLRQQHDNQQDFNGQGSAGIENSDWEPFEGFRVGVPKPPDMKELDGVNPLPKIGATEEGDTDAASLRQKQKENERFTTKSEDGEAYTRTLKDTVYGHSDSEWENFDTKPITKHNLTKEGASTPKEPEVLRNASKNRTPDSSKAHAPKLSLKAIVFTADDETLLARQTPGVSIQQLEALSAHLNNTLIPETNALFNADFSDLAARDEAHELLSQRIWREVTHESRLAATKDPEARTLKKGLVSETQYVVHRLYDALEMARK